MYKGPLHTKTSFSTAGSWAGCPKLSGTQFPHQSHNHQRNTASKTRPLKPWGDATALPFWLTYTREHLATISCTLSTNLTVRASLYSCLVIGIVQAIRIYSMKSPFEPNSDTLQVPHTTDIHVVNDQSWRGRYIANSRCHLPKLEELLSLWIKDLNHVIHCACVIPFTVDSNSLWHVKVSWS